MKLSQYIYGRRPNSGLQVIARSAELPFFLAQWMEAPRYGSAPVRETPDRIWAQRYELQSFEEGMLMSCMYPLKQTDVPCSEQQAPYIRGITPAVQHLLVTPNDAVELLSHVDSSLRFDGFFAIDDIYRLSGAFLEPVEFTPQTVAAAELTPAEQTLCLDLAVYLWRAFVTRKEGRRGELFQRCVYLIVPAGTPEKELEDQRRIVAAALNLLPTYIRRWTSVTLNMEVESDSYPTGSAMYGMARAQSNSQLTGKNVIFDIERMEWPRADEAEHTYLQLRQMHAPVVLLDEVVDALPQKDDLSFHIRLQQLADALCRNTATSETIEAFLAQEGLTNHRDAVCKGLADVVIAFGADRLNRQHLSALWHLCTVSPKTADKLNGLACPVEEALAVLTRDGVLTEHTGLQVQDESFVHLIINRAAADQEPLSMQAQAALKNWSAAHTAVDVSQYHQLYYSLIDQKHINITDGSQLAFWQDSPFFRYLRQLPPSTDWQRVLDEVEPETLSRQLLHTIDLNMGCTWTTDYELQMIRCFQRKQILPNWSEQDCNLAAKRAYALRDQQSQLPVLIMRCVERLGQPVEGCATLLRNSTICNLPEMQTYIAQYSQYVQMQNVSAFAGRITRPDDLLQLPALWQQISGSPRMFLTEQQWLGLQPRFIKAMQGLDIKGLIDMEHKLQERDLPAECVRSLDGAIVQCVADALAREDIGNKTLEEIGYLHAKLSRMNEAQLGLIGQRGQVVMMLYDIHCMPCDLPTFQKVRNHMGNLNEDCRSMFVRQLQFSNPYKPSFILLIALQRDNTIDWQRAVRDLSIAFKLPPETPNEYAKRNPSDEYDGFCSMIFELYENRYPGSTGRLLSLSDVQGLSAWLLATSPKFINCLKKDQKRYGDLPDAVVEQLSLSRR